MEKPPKMIVGTGVDIIEIERVKAAYARWGERFLTRVYRQQEIDYCLTKKNPSDSLAARFAAKEAGFKAFSQAGIKILLWRNLWVDRDQFGRPTLRSNPATDLLVHLALSHSRHYAVASVIIEKQ